MRRLALMLTCLLILLLPAVAAAQEAVSEPDLAAAVEQAQAAAEEARRYAEDASNYLGIFESVGVAIGVFTGIVVPVLAIIAGFTGLSQLREARRELSDARERMELELQALRDKLAREMQDKQAELDALKKELEDSAHDERVRSDQATLALSLLPLAERQYRVNDYQGALHTYHRALELDPDNIVIHYLIGYVNTQMGNLDEAEKHLNRALELDSKFAPALANLGYVLRRRADQLPADDMNRGRLMAEAELKLREALNLAPKLVDEDGESWWGSLGGLHRRRGQLDDAIEAYKLAQQVTPAASYPAGNLALLYLQKRDKARMLEMFHRTERLAHRRVLADGGDFWGWADLMVARVALGKFDEAKETLEWLLASTPETATHMLENPLETLRLLRAHADAETAARLQPLIEGLENRLATLHRAQTPAPPETLPE
ncbi:MAG: tetratricopeptide repeat protein [Chloroflexota bacterium]